VALANSLTRSPRAWARRKAVTRTTAPPAAAARLLVQSPLCGEARRCGPDVADIDRALVGSGSGGPRSRLATAVRSSPGKVGQLVGARAPERDVSILVASTGAGLRGEGGISGRPTTCGRHSAARALVGPRHVVLRPRRRSPRCRYRWLVAGRSVSQPDGERRGADLPDGTARLRETSTVIRCGGWPSAFSSAGSPGGLVFPREPTSPMDGTPPHDASVGARPLDGSARPRDDG
jgi:hypothetical protein